MFEGMEYVYTVYKEKSFSRAAEKLFISQPSLSANVKRVERRIGYPIFERGSKPLTLTDCGRRFIQSVEKIMEIESEFTDYVDDLGELKVGGLRFGGSNLFSSWVLPPLMAEFSRRYPGIVLSLTEDSTTALSLLLQKGEVDFVLDNCILDPAVFERKKFLEEHLLLAVPGTCEINRELEEYRIPADRAVDREYLEQEAKEVPLAAFANEPFIMLKPLNDTGRRAVEICREQGFTPRVALELDQQMTAYNVSCSGMGISFVGNALLSHFPFNNQVVYYKPGGSHTIRSIYFYWKKGRYANSAMKEFLRCLDEGVFRCF
ncbi:MAG: LysR family transcriptional regulator [Clostridiales bacterium]|nr:LysR family transcriptional regulator [Clostridiales bacterium]